MALGLYRTRVHEDLIIALRGNGIPDYKILGFFNDQINLMIHSEPTYKKGSKCNFVFKHSIFNNFEQDTWVTRGYFPNTGIFYKITMVDTLDTQMVKYSLNNKERYYAKVQMWLRPVTSNGNRRQRPAIVELESKVITELISEHEIFGSSNIGDLVVKPQRTMAIKGSKPNRLNKKRRSRAKA